MENPSIQSLANSLIAEETKKQSFHAVMLFFQKKELGGFPADNGKEWVCKRTLYFDNIESALDCYANTPCPASQILHADTREELKSKIAEMKSNYRNESWLNENVYPYI